MPDREPDAESAGKQSGENDVTERPVWQALGVIAPEPRHLTQPREQVRKSDLATALAQRKMPGGAWGSIRRSSLGAGDLLPTVSILISLRG